MWPVKSAGSCGSARSCTGDHAAPHGSRRLTWMVNAVHRRSPSIACMAPNSSLRHAVSLAGSVVALPRSSAHAERASRALVAAGPCPVQRVTVACDHFVVANGQCAAAVTSLGTVEAELERASVTENPLSANERRLLFLPRAAWRGFEGRLLEGASDAALSASPWSPLGPTRCRAEVRCHRKRPPRGACRAAKARANARSCFVVRGARSGFRCS